LKTYWTILILFIGVSTFGQKRLTGYYSSNKAQLGFFVTQIQLNEDSTFKYEFSGDLAYDNGTGKYWTEKKKLIHLNFYQPKLDSAQRTAQALQGGGPSGRPKTLLFHNGRLFFADSAGRKKGKGFMKKRKGQELKFRGENASH